METTEKEDAYVLGVKLVSKGSYDKLMKNHSNKGRFGLDFEGLFQGYPEDDQYPCLVEYYVSFNPTAFMYAAQVAKIIDAGYTVTIRKE